MSSERFPWFIAVIATASLACLTIYQLEDFKRRAVVKPAGNNSVDVEQSTEDAIKLPTLEALARGVNPELRNAALKILCERALKENNLTFMLEQAESENITDNLMTLKALGLVYQNVSPRRLVQPRVFKCLIGMLLRIIRTGANEHATGKLCQREAVFLLSRLALFGDEGQQYALDAGFIEWIKEFRVPGYDNILHAAFDMDATEPMDSNLYELLSAFCDDGSPGRDALLQSGMLRDLGGSVRNRTHGHREWPGFGVSEPVGEHVENHVQA